MPTFTLPVSDDIELRLRTLADAPDLFALVDANRTHLRRWLPWVDATTSTESSEAYIHQAIQNFEWDGSVDLRIWHKGEMAGSAGFGHITTSNRSTTIGYWLGESFSGQGIMTKSVATILDYAFGALNLNRVELHCAVGNERSRAVAERLGFKQEGILREVEWLYDHFEDAYVYSILAEEWKH